MQWLQNMCQHFVMTTSFWRWWHTLQLIMLRRAAHSACTRTRAQKGPAVGVIEGQR